MRYDYNMFAAVAILCPHVAVYLSGYIWGNQLTLVTIFPLVGCGNLLIISTHIVTSFYNINFYDCSVLDMHKVFYIFLCNKFLMSVQAVSQYIPSAALKRCIWEMTINKHIVFITLKSVFSVKYPMKYPPPKSSQLAYTHLCRALTSSFLLTSLG